MSELGAMLAGLMGGPLGQDLVDGLGVSTVNTFDAGLETSIFDKVSVYPVERYETEDDALAGHDRWVEKAVGLSEITVLAIPDHDEFKDGDIITLERPFDPDAPLDPDAL